MCLRELVFEVERLKYRFENHAIHYLKIDEDFNRAVGLHQGERTFFGIHLEIPKSTQMGFKSDAFKAPILGRLASNLYLIC